MRWSRATAVLAGGLAVAGCESVPVTRPYDPPLAGIETAFVVLAVVLVTATGAALVLVRPLQPLPRAPRTLGAFGLAIAAAVVSLAVLVQVGAAFRMEELGCAALPREDLPETLLQLRCTPATGFGGDTGGLVPFFVVLFGVPLAVALVLAARLTLAGFATEWVAAVSALLGGVALFSALQAASRARVVGFSAAGLFFAVALVLALEVMVAPDAAAERQSG